MTVTLEREGAIAMLQMDRAEALNAFDGPMVDRMRDKVSEIQADSTIEAVVLAGAGRSFCTGVDVKLLQTGDIGLGWFRDWHHMITEIENLDIPVVAAIQGHCLGGGVMLTLATDYRIGTDDLTIGFGAVRHGILPGTAPYRLADTVGAVAARRLCLFGEYVAADEALRIGLVDRVVPASELQRVSRDVAERAASFSTSTLRELKRLMRVAPSLGDASYEAAFLAAQQRCLDQLGR
jgi:enoyl-CoA hydratase/carnithine racemase